MSITIGIDPGYRAGGVALIGDNWAEVHDLPVFDKDGLDAHSLAEIIASVEASHIWLEYQQAMPRQGVSSTGKLMMAYGQIRAVVALSGVPYTIVRPAKWKQSMNVPKDKDGARRLAIQWYPDLSDRLKRKKDEHRAEALLIARYGRGV